jgi:CRP/FNR family transcriptional regulator, cyclic AMP receptor protein
MLRPLGPGVVEHLHAIGTPISLRLGDPLFHQGDTDRSVYFLTSGQLRIVVTTPAGRELLIATKSPGELVGELSCLDPAGERTASLIADTDCERLVFSGDAFRRALIDHGELAVALLEDLAGQLRRLLERVTARNSTDILTRLAGQLVRLCATIGEHAGPKSRFELEITQEDLAAWIGATRESVARSLAVLREDNIVSTGRQRIRVHDLAALEDLALA